MAEPVGRNVRLYGRVQGVFYRQWAVDRARSLGVDGWVRNRRDGSVEAHVAGDEGAVARMIDEMRRGPSHACVEGVTVTETEPEPVEGFSVRV